MDMSGQPAPRERADAAARREPQSHGSPIRRIGVLTGGGDCPGLNAVIRALVRTAVGRYGWEVVGIEDGFEGLLEPGRTRPLTLDRVRGLLPLGGTILGTTNRCNPFAFAVRAGDSARTVDRSAEVVDRIADLGLDALVVVGGDGTLAIAEKLHRLGVPVVGVPKTIDNDLAATDVTFGYQTSVATAVEGIDRLHTTAESHHRVMIVEVMGRHAGWIALESGLAGGADAILLPEIPFELEHVVAALTARQARGRSFSAGRRPGPPAAGWQPDRFRPDPGDALRRGRRAARRQSCVRTDGGAPHPAYRGRTAGGSHGRDEAGVPRRRAGADCPRPGHQLRGRAAARRARVTRPPGSHS
jgi:hypothetical protein